MKNRAKYLFLFTLFFILLIIDIFSKYLANKLLDFGVNIIIIPNVVSFEKVYNSGAAFGLFMHASFLLLLISLIISLVIIYFLFSKKFDKTVIEYVSLIFILSGAIGNMIDRIIYKHVIDFISLQFINFPVFNFADICINIGVILLLSVYLFGKKNECARIYKN